MASNFGNDFMTCGFVWACYHKVVNLVLDKENLSPIYLCCIDVALIGYVFELHVFEDGVDMLFPAESWTFSMSLDCLFHQ